MAGIVFSDVDGTLVGSDHHAISQSATPIQRVAAHVPICLVSARSPEGLYPIQHDLGFEGPLACYSGAYVLDDKGNELFSCTIPTELAIKAKRIAKEEFPTITVGTYGFHNWIADDTNDPRIKNEEYLVQTRARACSDIASVFGDKGVHKLLLMGEQETIAQVEQIMRQEFPMLNVVRSSAILCEVMSYEADKGNAVRLLCDHYGVDPADAIAFGDGPNDIDMLRAVGTSFAMANAEDSVKTVATHVLPWSNVECGVAQQLTRSFPAYFAS